MVTLDHHRLVNTHPPPPPPATLSHQLPPHQIIRYSTSRLHVTVNVHEDVNLCTVYNQSVVIVHHVAVDLVFQ